MALLVYVDDIVIRSSSMKATADVKNYLSSKLKLKDLGSPKYFIGLEIAKLKEGICISQIKYTLDMLEDYCLLGLKPISTPSDYNHKLSQAIDVDVLSNAIKYKQLVSYNLVSSLVAVLAPQTYARAWLPSVVAHDLQLFEYSILSNPIILATSSDPTRLVINLIHRDSIHSPYYDKREDFTARLEHTMQIRRTLPTVDIQPDIHPSGFLFLVNFSIGQPPIPQLAIMDTGSSLLWVQCQPCRRCFKQYSPIYDSRSSSTYTILPCTSVYCIYLQPPTASCTSSDPCQYHQQYLNFVDSIGTLAKEQISFRTSDDGLAALHDVIFGCSSNNGDLQRDGDGVEGDSTTLEVIDGHYHVLLEGISVGEQRLPINPYIFRRTKENVGVIIDSGTVSTWLIKEGYDAVVKQVQSLLNPWLTQIDDVCYKGKINQDLIGFPTVTFQFVGGAELVLDTQSLFIQMKPNEFALLCNKVRATTL
ncbi:PREDICTED: aspartic proteinase nepenthesin-1-like [Theobroma cacao]|uniref:Aspartic proteinase nepenthesin-1-like n=1 Tax=Theobroma cacao TaxID=3641 RepID=A0AB32WUA4_THECC|nr:PREDICTED: aspartic proteinase nepenthesin-1-like [Theobroma cacao]